MLLIVKTPWSLVASVPPGAQSHFTGLLLSPLRHVRRSLLARCCWRTAIAHPFFLLTPLGTTVGYGLPSSVSGASPWVVLGCCVRFSLTRFDWVSFRERTAFFQNCPQLQVAIYFQMVWSMMFNAFLFAFFYSRIGRGEIRGIQVVFSKHAIVSVVRALPPESSVHGFLPLTLGSAFFRLGSRQSEAPNASF